MMAFPIVCSFCVVFYLLNSLARVVDGLSKNIESTNRKIDTLNNSIIINYWTNKRDMSDFQVEIERLSKLSRLFSNPPNTSRVKPHSVCLVGRIKGATNESNLDQKFIVTLASLSDDFYGYIILFKDKSQNQHKAFATYNSSLNTIKLNSNDLTLNMIVELLDNPRNGSGRFRGMLNNHEIEGTYEF